MIAAYRRPDSMSAGQLFGLRLSAILALIMLTMFSERTVQCAPITHITVDGNFNDWASVPTYTDPDGGPGVLHNGIPDTHHTDDNGLNDVPSFRDHPDVDILEYKFTHDENNLYAYFKADGVIGRTKPESSPGSNNGGRYYVIVTIDVDNDNSTGYFLHQGGYYPTSGTDRYDMNMEAEYYGGSLNTAHYLSHDALGGAQLAQDFLNLTSGGTSTPANPGPHTPGYVQPAPGNYDDYTQWVYHDNDTLTLVEDKGPIVPGIMTVELSPDGHEIEIAAPFKGFLNDFLGNPNMALGKTIDVSFSLEASGELAPGNDWASDTADPISSYFLDTYPGDLNFDGFVDASDAGIMFDNWGPTTLGYYDGNLNGDGFIDAADVGIMFANWTSDVGPAATSIPEPSTLLLVGLAGVLFGCRRRRV